MAKFANKTRQSMYSLRIENSAQTNLWCLTVEHF